MFLAFVRSMLGSLGRPVLDFMINNPSLVTGVLTVWLGVFVAGRLQLRHIERKSVELVLEMGRELIARKPHITARGLYKRIYPRWSEAVREWAWFVPHRLDLWPVPARPETVQQKLPFSAQWIAEVLHQYGIPLEKNGSNTKTG
ncbi:MAG: hypothetical protein L6435_09965 [Anaerolineae bacterium]|nr:hypothetical protein [Anaerolineae bacterium]